MDFIYLENEIANRQLRLSENIAEKLTYPPLNKQKNIKTYNNFISIKSAEILKAKNITFVGTIKVSRNYPI